MGMLVNPSADGFAEILRSGCYIDKSMLISYTNSVIGTTKKLICFSRPRRFGKSFAAKMLAAYYSSGADSEMLFHDLEIQKRCPEQFREYHNRFDVIFIDTAMFLSIAKAPDDAVKMIQNRVIGELKKQYPDCMEAETESLFDALEQVYETTNRKFYIIIDEWDALFREAKDNTAVQKEYIRLLRSLFKSALTVQVIAGAYMTGILPIKKYGTQSALTDFYEFTMLDPGPLSGYVGFTEGEVRGICAQSNLDFEETRRWYDGYHFGSMLHIYNPNSIMRASAGRRFGSYWTQTETYESLKLYMELNFDGLRDAIVDMLGGKSCRVDTGTFQNDMTSLQSRDDVFTLLVHLGYLAYDIDKKEVSIPNQEIREEFIRVLKNGSRKELVKAVNLSDRLLEATLRMDEKEVAALIAEAHMANTSPTYYNDEQALRSVVILAYFSCVDQYRRFEELAGGRGYIDLLFLPVQNSGKPPLLLELKWDKSPGEAIRQIDQRDYIRVIEKTGYKGNVLLVGINYSTKTQEHTCKIEKREIG